MDPPDEQEAALTKEMQEGVRVLLNILKSVLEDHEMQDETRT